LRKELGRTALTIRAARRCGRFFALARGSAMESAAILDACRILKLAETDTVQRGKALLERIVGMLTKMCR
jgi:hypothetical protein